MGTLLWLTRLAGSSCASVVSALVFDTILDCKRALEGSSLLNTVISSHRALMHPLIEGMLMREGNPSGKADVILSDMAGNASGNTTRDIESSLTICQSVFEFAQRHLRTARELGRKHGGVIL